MPALTNMLAAMLWLPLSAMACSNTSPDPAEVVQAQVDAYNAHDVATFASCYADDVTVTDLGGKRPPITGRDALKKAYAFLATRPKEFHAAIVQRVVNGPIVVDHERLMGLPADKGPADAIAMYEVRDGKILHVWFPPRS
ncbi:nuclear transport factor 2 family protein [Dyella japonica]|uniref:SnoaL-like domain-containing protein n=1 Tax=Dyella japonica A8 TaxID=1217721 RepID=A0A075K524_9GAMM|nr:nuclear transport factor 2 family protein [Dyella japonica]AIF48792.1 hypothetical protein HY57_16850 [Dyella japonica A8]